MPNTANLSEVLNVVTQTKHVQKELSSLTTRRRKYSVKVKPKDKVYGANVKIFPDIPLLA